MPKAAPTTAKTSTKPNTMTGLAGWVEVFKAGSHIDSKGRRCSFSRDDLDQMIDNHKLGAAPAVIGHPKVNDPAYAQVESYKRDGDRLFAKFTKIHPAFEKGVETGAYYNRSLSVFKDDTNGWRVRHVGWLGAVPPAIDGLEPVEFADGDAEIFEFAAPGYSLVWGLESAGKLLRGLRESIVADKGIEEADKVMPVWQIDGVLEAASQARTQFQEADAGRLFSQSDNPGGSMSISKEDLDAAIAKALADGKAAATAEFASKDEELTQLRVKVRSDRIGGLIKGWKAEGKVLPAEELGLAEFMGALEDAESEFTFSAGDGKEAKKTPAVFFAEFMAARSPLIKLGRTTRTGDDPGVSAVDLKDSNAIAKAARTFQAAEAKEGREISIEAAVTHVTSQAA
ncbi:hypothetical protein J2W28_002060 [Variovorax boronicumulans]|uniref:hypothetical protein n=1 Tax=Variovorax boronicumulans TaxID=436515 RepID=UPI0027804BB1|nr:hypothetical protein [Variovorax boronicumulans]MDP9990890.1 hypothetical protein [Variovorax boronicumulans]MDQ0002918.1 hypothetical protein [Variovorax boronicumulans]